MRKAQKVWNQSGRRKTGGRLIWDYSGDFEVPGDMTRVRASRFQLLARHLGHDRGRKRSNAEAVKGKHRTLRTQLELIAFVTGVDGHSGLKYKKYIVILLIPTSIVILLIPTNIVIPLTPVSIVILLIPTSIVILLIPTSIFILLIPTSTVILLIPTNTVIPLTPVSIVILLIPTSIVTVLIPANIVIVLIPTIIASDTSACLSPHPQPPRKEEEKSTLKTVCVRS